MVARVGALSVSPIAPEDVRGKVVLVPCFMAPELPVLQRHRAGPEPFRREEHRGRGLVVTGMYHKDPEPLNVETVRGYVEHFRFRRITRPLRAGATTPRPTYGVDWRGAAPRPGASRFCRP